MFNLNSMIYFIQDKFTDPKEATRMLARTINLWDEVPLNGPLPVLPEKKILFILNHETIPTQMFSEWSKSERQKRALNFQNTGCLDVVALLQVLLPGEVHLALQEELLSLLGDTTSDKKATSSAFTLALKELVGRQRILIAGRVQFYSV